MQLLSIIIMRKFGLVLLDTQYSKQSEIWNLYIKFSTKENISNQIKTNKNQH